MNPKRPTLRTGIALAALALVCSEAAWSQSSSSADKQVRALKREVRTLREEIKTLRGERTALDQDRKAVQAQLRALREQVLAMRDDLRGLKANSILDLNGYLAFDNSSGYPTAVFRGVNLSTLR